VAKILKGSKLSLLLSLNFLDKQKELNLFPTKTSRISVEQKKRSLLDQKQLVSTQRNRVNERKLKKYKLEFGIKILGFCQNIKKIYTFLFHAYVQVSQRLKKKNHIVFSYNKENFKKKMF